MGRNRVREDVGPAEGDGRAGHAAAGLARRRARARPRLRRGQDHRVDRCTRPARRSARRRPLARHDRIRVFALRHWKPDPDPALHSIRAALKAGGRAQLRMVTAGSRQSLESVVEEARQSSRWREYFAGFGDPYLRLTPEQYIAAAERNGLRATRVQTRDETWDFELRTAFHAFCAVGLVAWTQRLPETDRTPFVDDVLDRYRTITGDPAGAETTFKFYQTDFALVLSGA